MADDDIFSKPGHLINRLARISNRWLEVRLHPLGFSAGQMPVLNILKDGASLTQKDLARRVQIEQPTMAQLLTRMERDGLIRRTHNPADKRSSLFTLTPLALRVLPSARAILSEGKKQTLKGFTDREVATLTGLLLRIVQNFDPDATAEIKTLQWRRRTRS